MLCLSIGAIALIIIFNANRPDSAAIALACKSEVGTAISKESDKVAKACEQAAKTQAYSYPGSVSLPSFELPTGWSATVEPAPISPDDKVNISQMASIYPTPVIYSCVECDGGSAPVVTVTTQDKTTAMTGADFKDEKAFASYLQDAFATASSTADFHVNNVKVQQGPLLSPFSCGTTFFVSSTQGSSDGFWADHTVEHYYIIGEKHITNITYNEILGSSKDPEARRTALRAQWDQFKASVNCLVPGFDAHFWGPTQ
jgi:hypothetical protein